MITTKPGSGRASVAARIGTTGATVLGLATLAVGAVAVFVSTNEAGTVALIAAGVALLVLGFFGDRVTPSRVQEGERRGIRVPGRAAAPEPAAPGGERAPERTPLSAPAYPENTPSPARQSALDRGHGLAKRPSLRRADVTKLFGDENEAKRLTALAIIQRRPDLGSLDILLASVAGSTSAFEQYQGLVAARAAVESRALNAAELTSLTAEIRRQLEIGRFAGDDCTQLAEQILGS